MHNKRVVYSQIGIMIILIWYKIIMLSSEGSPGFRLLEVDRGMWPMLILIQIR